MIQLLPVALHLTVVCQIFEKNLRSSDDSPYEQ
jgi:hypothetical protein